jgi:hypothetical protein
VSGSCVFRFLLRRSPPAPRSGTHERPSLAHPRPRSAPASFNACSSPMPAPHCGSAANALTLKSLSWRRAVAGSADRQKIFSDCRLDAWNEVSVLSTRSGSARRSSSDSGRNRIEAAMIAWCWQGQKKMERKRKVNIFKTAALQISVAGQLRSKVCRNELTDRSGSSSSPRRDRVGNLVQMTGCSTNGRRSSGYNANRGRFFVSITSSTQKAPPGGAEGDSWGWLEGRAGGCTTRPTQERQKRTFVPEE